MNKDFYRSTNSLQNFWLRKCLYCLILVFLINLISITNATSQIVIAGTNLDPMQSEIKSIYSISEISQYGILKGTLSVNVPLAANTAEFNSKFQYAITDNPYKLNNTLYNNFSAPDYALVFTGPLNNQNILEYKLTDFAPGSNVSVVVDYCNPNKSTVGTRCFGPTTGFKGIINPDENNGNFGLDALPVAAGQCKSHTFTGKASATGEVVFRINSVYNGECASLAISKIEVKGSIMPKISSAQGNEICMGEQILLSVNQDYENAAYTWQVNDGSGWKPFSSNKSVLYELTSIKQYDFRLALTTMTSVFYSDVLTVNSAKCCEIGPGALTSRQTIFHDNFGRLDLTDKSGTSYYVWDYSDPKNPVEVLKKTTTPFRWRDESTDLKGIASFQGRSGSPVIDGEYTVASYLTAYYPHNGYSGAQLLWANQIHGNPSDINHDHSGKVDGGVFLMNIPFNSQGMTIYEREFDNLCLTNGRTVYFETYISVFTSAQEGVDLNFRLTDGTSSTNSVLIRATATKEAIPGSGKWVKVSGQLEIIGNSVKLEIINNSTLLKY